MKVSRGTSVVLLLVYGMYLLFQLKSHAYMYESTPQHIIDEELAPGPVAAWMDSSDSDSSSSSSDSDGSSGSNTTAKRIKRVMRGGRRRRKSSAGSKDTADIEAIRTPSFGTTSMAPVNMDYTEEPHQMVPHNTMDTAEDADDEEKGRSRRSSILGHSHLKKERKKDRKRREKRERKASRRNGDDTINEGVVATSSNEKQVEATTSPRRVDFAVVGDNGPLTDSAQKRPFTLRGISSSIPKPLYPSVFSTQPSPAPTPPPVAGPIPRVKYGIRRTNSLPDRLNQTMSAPARSHSNLQPLRALSTAVAENKPPPHEDDDENISRTTAVFLLLISTGLVAVCAEFLVDSINAVVETSPLSEAFVGLIILPIVGNAAEHVTAVTVASVGGPSSNVLRCIVANRYYRRIRWISQSALLLALPFKSLSSSPLSSFFLVGPWAGK